MKMRRGGGRTLTKERSYLTEGEKKIEDKRDFFFFFFNNVNRTFFVTQIEFKF